MFFYHKDEAGNEFRAGLGFVGKIGVMEALEINKLDESKTTETPEEIITVVFCIHQRLWKIRISSEYAIRYV